MSGLDPQSAALVEALRSESLEADPKERVRARLAAAGVLGAAAGAPVLAAAQPLAAALVKPASWLGLAKGVVLGAGALAASTLAVITVTHTWQPPSELATRARPVAASPRANAPAPVVPASSARMEMSEPSAERPAAEPVAPVAPSRKAPAQAETQPAERAPRRSDPEVMPAATAAPASSTLASESALLARAVRALNEGRSDEAHALLREHAQHFPGGLLVRERERALERLGVPDGP